MATNFDLLAPSYLRTDEHWGSDIDVLKIAVIETTARRPKVRYLDVGCGPGFHLALMKYLYPEIYVTGIDSSVGMLREARDWVQRLMLDDATLLQSDILQFWESIPFNVVSFLNNGLGNLSRGAEPTQSVRENAIRKIRTLMCGGDAFVLSVYNLEKFDLNYGTHLVLTKRHDTIGDFHFEFRPIDQKADAPIEFYSHWFRENEVATLLEQNGFEIELFEKRMFRLVVKAKAV